MTMGRTDLEAARLEAGREAVRRAQAVEAARAQVEDVRAPGPVPVAPVRPPAPQRIVGSTASPSVAAPTRVAPPSVAESRAALRRAYAAQAQAAAKDVQRKRVDTLITGLSEDTKKTFIPGYWEFSEEGRKASVAEKVSHIALDVATVVSLGAAAGAKARIRVPKPVTVESVTVSKADEAKGLVKALAAAEGKSQAETVTKRTAIHASLGADEAAARRASDVTGIYQAGDKGDIGQAGEFIVNTPPGSKINVVADVTSAGRKSTKVKLEVSGRYEKEITVPGRDPAEEVRAAADLRKLAEGLGRKADDLEVNLGLVPGGKGRLSLPFTQSARERANLVNAIRESGFKNVTLVASPPFDSVGMKWALLRGAQAEGVPALKAFRSSKDAGQTIGQLWQKYRAKGSAFTPVMIETKVAGRTKMVQMPPASVQVRAATTGERAFRRNVDRLTTELRKKPGPAKARVEKVDGKRRLVVRRQRRPKIKVQYALKTEGGTGKVQQRIILKPQEGGGGQRPSEPFRPPKEGGGPSFGGGGGGGRVSVLERPQTEVVEAVATEAPSHRFGRRSVVDVPGRPQFLPGRAPLIRTSPGQQPAPRPTAPTGPRPAGEPGARPVGVPGGQPKGRGSPKPGGGPRPIPEPVPQPRPQPQPQPKPEPEPQPRPQPRPTPTKATTETPRVVRTGRGVVEVELPEGPEDARYPSQVALRMGNTEERIRAHGPLEFAQDLSSEVPNDITAKPWDTIVVEKYSKIPVSRSDDLGVVKQQLRGRRLTFTYRPEVARRHTRL